MYPHMTEDKMLDTLGPDGVKQIYPTKPRGTEFYLNMKDPYMGGAYTNRRTSQFNISFGILLIQSDPGNLLHLFGYTAIFTNTKPTHIKSVEGIKTK